MNNGDREEEEKIIFFDIETNSQFAPYASLKMVGYQIGMVGTPKLLDLNDSIQTDWFRQILDSPDYTKVHFNGINFDEIVLRRHGFPVNPINRHDVFLMAKTVSPMLPAYGLKFLNWYFYGDPHKPERALGSWIVNNSNLAMYQAPLELLRAYCLYDVVQTVRLWTLFWPIVQRERHWRAYSELELPMGEVLHEIILEGGDCVNHLLIDREIRKLEDQVKELNEQARVLSEGRVTNVASGKQVARELVDTEGFELEISEKGNLLLRKDDLLTLLDLDNPTNDTSKLARMCYEIRSLNNSIGFLRAYCRAALYQKSLSSESRLHSERGYVQIPKSYSLSAARTRRILSNSRYGINFQNQNKVGKAIQLVPDGWLGVWLDSTQIENVVHMWKSKDYDRIRSYTSDPDWSEYVWLCNKLLGGHRTREELDGISSTANPAWSIYKQFKTCKLALNFGMGVSKFSRTNRIDARRAKAMFDDIHRACPAIRKLTNLIQDEVARKGFVQDPFGHIYTGDPDVAYKIVAYFIQGCGTGSVPKAMARAIYDILHTLPYIDLPSEEECDVGDSGSKIIPTKPAVMTHLVHDEIGFRIHLGLPTVTILATLRECLAAMEQRFSPLFDNIPLRAKASFSLTNSAEAKVINHNQMTWEEWETAVAGQYILPGKAAQGI